VRWFELTVKCPGVVPVSDSTKIITVILLVIIYIIFFYNAYKGNMLGKSHHNFRNLVF